MQNTDADYFKKADFHARARTMRGIISRLREAIRSMELDIEGKEKELAALDKAINEAE